MTAVQAAMSSNSPKIEIAQPRLFTLGAVLAVNAYGIFLALPVFFSALVVSVLPFGMYTVLLPFLAVAITALFLPFGLGNSYIVRLVRPLKPATASDAKTFIVQLTLSPRIRSGLRALLEDADDVGYLSVSESELVFQGDSVKLSVPKDCIEAVRPRNIGMRGLFVYGRRIEVVISGLPNVASIQFAERSSWLLPASRRVTRELCALFAAK